MTEGLAFSILLLLALYGIACLMHRLTLLILRPEKELHRFCVEYLREDTCNTEQIVRYFRATAGKGDVLLLVDNGVADSEKEIIARLCHGRRDVRFLDAQNFVEENCICGENAV